MNLELQKKLDALALTRTIAFCYGCYQRAPSGRCEKCHSDDLMRELPGIGCEYGLDWVVESILESELEAISENEAFEEHIRGCYTDETINVLWMSLDAIEPTRIF